MADNVSRYKISYPENRNYQLQVKYALSVGNLRKANKRLLLRDVEQQERATRQKTQNRSATDTLWDFRSK